MSSIVWGQIFWYAKPWDDMIKEKLGWCGADANESGNYFNPFGKVIDNNEIYLWPRADVGKHSLKSIPCLQKGSIVMIGCNGVSGALVMIENIW